jgi:glucose/arabinose dehydrogenase
MTPQLTTARARRAACAGSGCAAERLESRTLLATLQVPGFQDSLFASGLSAPTSMEFAPDGRLFVTQQGGLLRVILPGSTTPLTPAFLTAPTSANGERGLLSVTFDPNFMSNGFLYVYYTANTPTIHNRVSRFTAVDADPGPGYRPGNTAVAGSETPILDLDSLSSATNHNGGAMHFGPDGKLYVAVGENANGANSQVLTNRLGKMLRINSDGTIPTDNPFYTTAAGANRSIWALGLRNPYTFTFQPGTGRMFINDVGQNTFEEVDEGFAGANYGWPNIEGYRTTQTPPANYRDPVVSYGRAVGQTITGGAFYNPPVPNFPQQYVGKYFFADYSASWVRYIDPAINRPAINNFASGAGNPVDLDVGPDGALYYLGIGTGQVGRITWAGPRITTQPQSQTVTEGDRVTFEVAATGPGTLTYQWRRNGVNITGATGSSYTLDPATTDDNGAAFSVVVTNSAASVTSDPALLTVFPAIPRVVGRHVFYNHSGFDSRDPAANAADDGAIATDKKALLPGQVASFSNLTSYSSGINGIMVDVAHLPATATITAANFAFRTGKGDDNWFDAPAPAQIALRRADGDDGSDRITVTWTDGSIINRWLQVTFTATPLAATPINMDIFYFGNLRGEVGNPEATARLMVNGVDASETRRAIGRAAASITNLYDHNRDGRVNVLDWTVSARNRAQSVTLFTAPAPPLAAQRRSTRALLA